MMKNTFALGLTGVIALLVSLFVYLINPALAWVMRGSFGLGAACALAYLFLSRRALTASLGGRTARYGLNMALTLLSVLALLAAVNFIAAKHPKKYDVTEGGLHTLADQTVKVLKSLKQEIRFTAFFQTGEPQVAALKAVVEQYKYETDKISIQIIDPLTDPAQVERYKITKNGPRVILETTGEGATPREVRLTRMSEEEITNAVIQLTREKSQKVYLINGHGERTVEDPAEPGYKMMAEALTSEGLEIAPLTLLQTAEVPRDADAVLLIGAVQSLFPPEVETLKKYLAEGGHLLAMLEPQKEHGLNDLFGQWGVEVGNNIVVDQLSRMFNFGAAVPVIQQYGESPITKDFRLATFFPTARSVTAGKPGEQRVRIPLLASSSAMSWGETDLGGGQVQFDAATDLKGPVSLAATGTQRVAEEATGKRSTEARLLVFGDSDFASNQWVGTGGNKDLFLNSVHWLVGQGDLISIRPKARKSSRIFLSETQGNLLKYGTQWIWPGTFFLLAAAVYGWRRKK